MKVLAKLFYALAIIAMLATAVGFLWTLWINAIVGLKVTATACFSVLIFLYAGSLLEH